MKKLLIIAALLPTLLFGQQAKNVQVASGETFDENNIVVSAGGTRLRTIPIAWTSGNSTLSLTGNITLTGNVIANGIGGATVNGQVLLGNATSGDFQIGNISAGSGISLTPGAGTLQIAANQSLFQSVKVSGQNDIIATSPTANITIAATGGLVATTNNTTNTITLDGSSISSGSLFNGFTTSILTTESVPSGWSLTGVNGIPEHTAPDADYQVIIKMAGIVATPTFSPVAGAVPAGHTITLSSATSGVTFMTTNNTTDPSRSVGTAGGTWVVSDAQTIETMAYKDGAYLIDSAVASAAYTIDPLPEITAREINGNVLTLTYSEAVSRGAGYADAHFDLDMSTTGSNIGVTYVSGDGTTEHVYTAASAAVNGETVDLDFSGTANSIEETGGYNQDLAAITSAAVTNSTSGGTTWIYPPGWDVTATGGSTENIYDVDYANLSRITLPSAGTVTKIGLWVEFVNAAADMKFTVFDASRAPVATGITAAVAGANGEWKDYTTSISIPSAGDYYIGFSMDGAYTGAIVGKFKTAASGDTYVTFDAGSYGNFPSSLTGLTSGTAPYAVRVEFTPSP